MGLAFVLSTFLIAIVANVLIPSGDNYSDLALLVKSATFNLGESTLLQGCQHCYGKSEREVYSTLNTPCQQCTRNEFFACGHYKEMLKKLQELKESDTCELGKWKVYRNESTTRYQLAKF